MNDKFGFNLSQENWVKNNFGYDLPKLNSPVPPAFTQIKYGYLYNWYAATDVRNIANVGWSLPSVANIGTLINLEINSALKCSEVDTIYSIPYISRTATNSYNFNLKNSLNRYSSGTFDDGATGWYNAIITSDDSGLWEISSYYVSVLSSNFDVHFRSDLSYKVSGSNIRLFRLATEAELLLDNGTACDNYIGNDNKAYRTVKIGTQVWIADNLAETKYRNGDTIPTVTDNTAWSELTTGAKCAYNNDESNVLL